MGVGAATAGLLICSNVFMTFAWYAHLRDLRGRAWYVAALVSGRSRCSNTSCKSRRTGLATAPFPWRS